MKATLKQDCVNAYTLQMENGLYYTVMTTSGDNFTEDELETLSGFVAQANAFKKEEHKMTAPGNTPAVDGSPGVKH